MLPPGPSAPAWPGPPAAGGSAAGRKLQRRGREPVPALLPAGPPSSPRRAAAALSGSQSHFGEEGRGAGGEGGPQGRSSKVQLCAGVPAGSRAVAAGGALRARPGVCTDSGTQQVLLLECSFYSSALAEHTQAEAAKEAGEEPI